MDDFELEYKIKVHKETKNSSLYKWCIKETEKNGKKVEYSRDQIPWIWRNNFSTKSINYHPSWKLEKSENISTNKGKSKSKNKSNFVEEEVIIGTLVPEPDRGYDFQPDPTKYSMFGTNRLIEDFRFRIEINEEEKGQTKIK